MITRFLRSTVDASEIRHAPVVSLSHYLRQVLYIPGGGWQDSFHQK